MCVLFFFCTQLIIYGCIMATMTLASMMTLYKIYAMTSKIHNYALDVSMKTLELEAEKSLTDKLLYEMIPRYFQEIWHCLQVLLSNSLFWSAKCAWIHCGVQEIQTGSTTLQAHPVHLWEYLVASVVYCGILHRPWAFVWRDLMEGASHGLQFGWGVPEGNYSWFLRDFVQNIFVFLEKVWKMPNHKRDMIWPKYFYASRKIPNSNMPSRQSCTIHFLMLLFISLQCCCRPAAQK